MTTVILERRRNCYYDSFGRYRCYSTGWSSWGRWVLVGLIIAAFFLFMTCVCLTTRRRRRRGARPFYGTTWMTQGVQPQQEGYNQGPPPPQYGAPQQYNQGPNQESGYAPPLPETPKPVYGGGQNQYEMYNPPPGPPPNRYG